MGFLWQRKKAATTAGITPQAEPALDPEQEALSLATLIPEDSSVSFSVDGENFSGVFRFLIPSGGTDTMVLHFVEKGPDVPAFGLLSFPTQGGVINLEGPLHMQRNGVFLFRPRSGEMVERRRWERIAVDLPGVIMTGEASYSVHTSDVSQGGARLHGEALPAGELVTLKLESPSGEEFELKGVTLDPAYSESRVEFLPESSSEAGRLIREI